MRAFIIGNQTIQEEELRLLIDTMKMERDTRDSGVLLEALLRPSTVTEGSATEQVQALRKKVLDLTEQLDASRRALLTAQKLFDRPHTQRDKDWQDRLEQLLFKVAAELAP